MILFRLVTKNLRRRPLRTALTLAGVAAAMLLLVVVESLSSGLDRAMSGTESARTLIVYRLNRYCPQTSALPEWYASRIEKIAGVRSVLPVKVYLNNCRASLDVVAFQGAPPDQLLQQRNLQILEGDSDRFVRERDAALVGRSFAARRHLSVGDAFRFGAISVKVAGIFGSSEPVEEGVILTHLEYLQRAGPVNKLGTVTQFEVKIDDASRAKEIAANIDDLFRDGDAPTDTRAKIAFLESATRDLREILRFARWLGLACVAVVLALVGNSVLMSVQERVREFGVFRALGYHESFVRRLVLGEATALAIVGSAAGVAIAMIGIRLTHVAIGSEGVPVEFAPSWSLAARGLALAAASGVAAGLLPALRSGRAEIVDSLRSA